MNKLPALTFLALLALLGGCTSQQVYNSTSEWRAQQCAKLEAREQADCTAQARTSYGEMKKDRDATVEQAPRY